MAEHKMASLERKPSETKDAGLLEEATPEKKSFFPLSLHVSGPEIEKLRLSGVEVGEEHKLHAMVKVTSVSVSQRDGSEKREHVELTLLAGEIDSAHGKEDDKAKKMFGG